MKNTFSFRVMRTLLPFLLCAAPLAAPAAALLDDDMADTALSTDTAKGDYAPEDEDAQAQIQESDEDLVGYVEDYIKKDIMLKGAFLLEDLSAKKILRLQVDSVSRTVENGADNSKIVPTVFKDAAGKKYNVLFHLQSAGFSDVDIFKIELKKEEKHKAPAADKNGKKK